MSSSSCRVRNLSGVLGAGVCVLVLLPWQALSNEAGNTSGLLGNIADAQEVYDDNCAACHGYDGIPMLPGAANFSDRAGLKKSDSELLSIIVDGKGNMPEWRDDLTEDEQAAVLKYIKLFPGHQVIKENCSSCHNEQPHELMKHSLDDKDEAGTGDTVEICPGSDVETEINDLDSAEIGRYRKRLADLGGEK